LQAAGREKGGVGDDQQPEQVSRQGGELALTQEAWTETRLLRCHGELFRAFGRELRSCRRR